MFIHKATNLKASSNGQLRQTETLMMTLASNEILDGYIQNGLKHVL